MKTETRSGTKVHYRRRFLERLTLFVLSVILYIGINSVIPHSSAIDSQLYGDLIGLPIYVILGTLYSFSGLLDKKWIHKGIPLVLMVGMFGPLMVDLLGATSEVSGDVVYVPLVITYSVLTSVMYAIYALVIHRRTFKDE